MAFLLLDDQEADHEGRQRHHDGTPEALPKAAENRLTGPPGPAHTSRCSHDPNRPILRGSMSLVRVLGQSFLARAGHPRGQRGRLAFSYLTSVTNAPRPLRSSRIDAVKID